MDPMTMMMIAQGAVKAGQAGSRLLQPKFARTKYGQMMRERTRSGNLSQAQEKNILDKVGTIAGRNAQVARNRMVGSAINRGMGGSVALQRGLREAEADVRRTVADTGRDIYQNEEKAKSQAKLDYARAMDRDKAERRQAGVGMAMAGLETAGNLYGAKAGKQQAQDQAYLQAMQKYGKGNFSETFSPQTGESIGYTGGEGLTPDDKRQLEMFKEKGNMPNKAKLVDFLTASGDETQFEERLKYAQLLYPGIFKGGQ
jgi:hypothetical protein